MPAPRDIHNSTTQLLSVVMFVIGIALLVRTFTAGGGVLSLGVLLGVLFLAAGAGRFMIARRRR
ncbi:hypothetical protein [Conexibacter sp. CPCC 206217]|uniref:hypothetical protein n=1 Tax=Conexibacter sp. CPCC 206217 TaxID=3064574 RepID=UPI002728364D|nr:hypothetical protein [Conexibacter sp. CPCC 206217]MDO8210920.1 hypothetical protein [Conexibacter sp. CPCC 206217]